MSEIMRIVAEAELSSSLAAAPSTACEPARSTSMLMEGLLIISPEVPNKESGETEKVTDPESPGFTSLNWFLEFLSQVIVSLDES